MRPLPPLRLADATDHKSPAVRLPCGAVVRVYPWQMAVLRKEYPWVDTVVQRG
jgi:hypothetical protein